tara:strand:- start:989 stop:1120 length:132 start_codon:yes stop_codon:yes gene_type:complete
MTDLLIGGGVLLVGAKLLSLGIGLVALGYVAKKASKIPRRMHV